MKNLALIIGLINMLACSSMKQLPMDNSSFLKGLYKLQTKRKCGSYPKIEYEQRSKINEEFDFIDYSADTVFILQSLDIQYSRIYESVWNNNKMISYVIHGSEIEIVPNDPLRVHKLIEEWDIASIRNEESEHGGLLGGASMRGIRVIIEQDEIRMDCIAFQEFFDMSKDQ
jgi:hypothetical protein